MVRLQWAGDEALNIRRNKKVLKHTNPIHGKIKIKIHFVIITLILGGYRSCFMVWWKTGP